MSDSSQPFVSVIIPVFNDAERLKTCLAVLEDQTYPKSHYEIIVVDNGSSEDTKSMVEPFSQASFAFEPHPGSYAARNHGIALSEGTVIAFTDADCIPARDWIEKGVAHLLKIPNCGLVAGKVDLFFQSEQPTAVELYDGIKIGIPQEKFVEESHYGATANVFTFKQVLDTVGWFDDSLKSSGDREWGQRVFAAGYQLVYAEDTCVSHPARRTWRELRRKVVRVIGGHQDLKRKQGVSSHQLIRDALLASCKDFLPPFRMYFHVYSYQNLKGNKQRFQFMLAMLFVRYVRGWERIRLVAGGTSSRG